MHLRDFCCVSVTEKKILFNTFSAIDWSHPRISSLSSNKVIPGVHTLLVIFFSFVFFFFFGGVGGGGGGGLGAYCRCPTYVFNQVLKRGS